MSGNNGHPERWKIDSVLLDPSAGQGKMDPQFPGYLGLPFRGVTPDLKEDDPAHKQPRVAAGAHVEVLDMSKAEDLKRYEAISQTVANGFGVVSFEERQYDESTHNWRVFIRWGDLYTYNPEKGHNSGRTI